MLHAILKTFFIFLISTISFFTMSSMAFPLDSEESTCFTNPKIQQKYSKELRDLVRADQKERENTDALSKEQIKQLNANDLMRRKRVGEIMGEGCIQTKADYAAAALIYQHGDVPLHYYQAFFWANKAVSLGDLEQKKLVAMSIDRYLVSIGKKQLFATQFEGSSTTGWCFCLLPVERSFPDSNRMTYYKKTLSEQLKFLPIINKGKKNCENKECPIKLAPTPKGSIPGFW